jgi:hypothetical protein
MKNLSSLAAAIIALGIASSPAMSASSRTFVSGSPAGSDTGTCAITAPCRTFAFALTQTAPSGEIIVLSSGGYGPVTIGQAVSIINTSNFAGITVASGNGITINANTNDSVTLRGLTIDGGGVGSNGIVFNSGARLTIDQCNAINFAGSGPFAGNGILLQPLSGSPKVVITNTTATNNQYGGVNYDTESGSASTGLVIDHVTANINFFGIIINNNGSTANTSASVSNSIASENVEVGFAFSNVAASLDMSYASGNQGDGVEFSNGGMFSLGRSVIVNNNTGVSIGNSSAISYKDNRITGNGLNVDGTLTPVNPQ